MELSRLASSYSDGTGAHDRTLNFRQSFPVGTTVAGSTISTTVRPRACGRCTMPRGIVTPLTGAEHERLVPLYLELKPAL